MTTGRKILIGGGIISALLIVSAFTVLNKKWWARKIFLKWKIDTDLSTNAELIKNMPLSWWIDAYFNGNKDSNWKLRSAATVEPEYTSDIPEPTEDGEEQ
jgi:hypothetical protein